MMVQKSDAARNHEHAGEKPGGHSLARETPQTLAPEAPQNRDIRDISEAVPERNPAGYGAPWHCISQAAFMIHGSRQPGGYKRLIVQGLDRCQARRVQQDGGGSGEILLSLRKSIWSAKGALQRPQNDTGYAATGPAAVIGFLVAPGFYSPACLQRLERMARRLA